MRMSVVDLSEDFTESDLKGRNFINQTKRRQLGLEPFNCQTNSVEKYFCRDCDYTTDVATELQGHIRKFHRKIKSEGFVVVTQSYLCEKCGFETYSILNWFNHMSIDCLSDLKKKNKASRRKHLKSVDYNFVGLPEFVDCESTNPEENNLPRREPGTSSSEHIQWYECDKCDFRSKHNYNLGQHKSTEHRLVWYKCSRCAYRARRLYHLESHVRSTHLTDETLWYKCKKCGYCTEQESHLAMHEFAKHSKEYRKDWFRCDKCKFKSVHKSGLMRHLSTHFKRLEMRPKIKPFQLKIRKSSHWFRCEKCTYRTRYREDLDSHQLREHMLLNSEKSGTGATKFRMEELKFHLDHNYCKYTSDIVDHDYCKKV